MSGQATDRTDDRGGSTARRPAPRPGASGGSRRRGTDRGQTTIDFAIGMSVFLVSLAFVFLFVPGMLAPFTGGTQSETPAVNRVADDLTQSKLGSPAEPYVLEQACTEAFFQSATPPADCDFDGSTTAKRVGVSERIPVNVTIRSDLNDDGVTSTLCFDGSTLQERSGSCTTVLSRGPKPIGSGGKTVSATRVASLAGEDVTLEVVMW